MYIAWNFQAHQFELTKLIYQVKLEFFLSLITMYAYFYLFIYLSISYYPKISV